MLARVAPVTPETWLISDTHWGHDNIIRHCSRPVDHDELMFAGWETVVPPTGHIRHLGDVGFGRDWYGKHSARIRALPGYKELIRGNHDKLPLARYTDLGFTVLGRGNVAVATTRVMGFMVAFSHEPLPPGGPWDINIHGHIHNKPGRAKPNTQAQGYLNVSVEAINYQPVQLGTLLEGL